MLTIPELLVRDGIWKSVDGPRLQIELRRDRIAEAVRIERIAINMAMQTNQSVDSIRAHIYPALLWEDK